MPKLTAIELENFQTVSKHAVIPIRDLTLMFGPNGAGKSAIFDALDLMNLLFSNDWGNENKKINEYLDRWARRESASKGNDQIAFGLQFLFEDGWRPDLTGMEHETSLRHIAVASLWMGDMAEDFDGKNFRFFIGFKRSNFYGWSISELTIANDERKFLEIVTEGESDPRIKIHDADWIDLYPTNILKEKLKTIIHQDSCYSYYLAPRLEGMNPNQWFPHEIYSLSTLDDIAALNQLEAVAQQIVGFFKLAFNKHFFSIDHKSLPLVKASRTVPSSEEVISIISGEPHRKIDGKIGYVQNIGSTTTRQVLAKTLNKLQPHWSYLCASVAHNQTIETPASINTTWGDLDPISKINEMLREDLFEDNGYQLNGEVLCLTDLQEIIDSWVEDPRHYAKIVRLYLTDNHQRNVEIEDVGSGIGYILPVLASLAHDGRALIQQPELHLHPALQSALGESIIRAVENYKYHDQFCLIETHSEHILLRILKLLKNSNKREDEVLSPLTFEKVSILYFEPMPDGSTKIQRLRLTPDGKLIDRWPGGFFNERYKDLFDDE
ncbi:DUF3696 domain-containing protein [Polynucleobacter bastaniensis]|uniref:DUF3696 domain-containing protein n=1 Tax=Polynucleobacter bastaniensis TaxID=2081039 RepID=UPI001C0C04C5|nr:DUF3696 domain-containing protein [Polynucleobacter bastaniensis]MBU3598552.1 DUF3696 domain-containing protein [Polynucleobacter bastaniensis]